jgi:hypothetical protein
MASLFRLCFSLVWRTRTRTSAEKMGTDRGEPGAGGGCFAFVSAWSGVQEQEQQPKRWAQTGENLGPEAGLLGDGGENGPDVVLRLQSWIGWSANLRATAHLIGSDLGRRGHGAERLVLGRRLRHHHEVIARVRHRRARLPFADINGSRRSAAERVWQGQDASNARLSHPKNQPRIGSEQTHHAFWVVEA